MLQSKQLGPLEVLMDPEVGFDCAHTSSGFQDQMEEIFAQREVAVLKSCRHPNIVTFLGTDFVIRSFSLI